MLNEIYIEKNFKNLILKWKIFFSKRSNRLNTTIYIFFNLFFRINKFDVDALIDHNKSHDNDDW